MPLVILEKIAYLIAASSSKKVFRLSDKAKPVGPWRGAWVIMIAARGPEMENGQTLCKYQINIKINSPLKTLGHRLYYE